MRQIAIRSKPSSVAKSAYFVYDAKDGGFIGQIEDVVIDEGSRSKGVGRFLAMRLEEIGRGCGVLYIDQLGRTLGFYGENKSGFCPAERGVLAARSSHFQRSYIWCLYCTKLAPISKTNDVARSACVVKRN